MLMIKKKTEQKAPAEQETDKTTAGSVVADEEEKLKELTDTLQHLQAEFENYKKRTEKENCEFIKIANEDLIKALLPIIDNFELAFKSCRVKDDFYKGTELIYSQLIDALRSQGLKHIDCIGKGFDPYYHEVLITEESGEEPNTIIEELQKGYLLHDKVIRHSKVKIAKKKKEEVKKEEEKTKEDKSLAGN
jgi:molecular chaperone GrpE